MAFAEVRRPWQGTLTVAIGLSWLRAGGNKYKYPMRY